jgi:diphthine synthase
MTLYFIGLGLGGEKDITVRGLEAIKKADKIYLEEYTSLMSGASKGDLEKFYGKKIISADRELVESGAEKTLLKEAKKGDVAFLVIGDPFSATTHVELKIQADSVGVKTEVISNTSIINAVGIVGLDLYKYGRTTTIPFDNKDIKSPYEVVKNNLKNKMHTLVLLDLRPSENRFMRFNEGIEYLLRGGMRREQLCVGCCQIGSKEPIIKVGKARELLKRKYNKFPQCLIVVSKMHFKEEEALNLHR